MTAARTAGWPENWTVVHCRVCGREIGAYKTNHPLDVTEYPCFCGAGTLVEPPVRRAGQCPECWRTGSQRIGCNCLNGPP